MTYRDAYIAPLTPVEIYWNFHKGLFSVKVKGRVVAHVKQAVLSNATFRVSEAGRQRVLRERRKNVHATIRGLWVGRGEAEDRVAATKHVADVTYNPYKTATFVDAVTGGTVDFAPLVVLDAEARAKIKIRHYKREEISRSA